MAGNTATNFTVTVSKEEIVAKHRRNTCILTLGTEGDTYVSGGIPLPTYTNWGLRRNIDHLTVFGQPQDGFLWKYSASAHTMVGYRAPCGTVSVGTDVDAATAFVELATDVTLTTRKWYCEAVGW